MGFLIGNVLAILLASCVTMSLATGFFEYGSHLVNEQLAFNYRGQIPALTPVYTLPVKHNRSDLYMQYSYLRVEFGKKLTQVDTSYDFAHQILTFKVEYLTLFPIDIGVTGYSLRVVDLEMVMNVLAGKPIK